MDTKLQHIHSPADVRKLEMDGLLDLSTQIRRVILNTTNQNGGHLASNLGVVELTLALHYAYDTPHDAIIWDVGHQTYTHKLITGRSDQFETLRCQGGLSGFPKREESTYDLFNTGHSSTSISAAYGMAKARDLLGQMQKIVAVIGDGALTSGMAFEALNNLDGYQKNLTIVLNDNEMSISKNVGGLSKHLTDIRTKQSYVHADTVLRDLTSKIPYVGNRFIRMIHKMKGVLKYALTPGIVFEEMGIKYIGPVDGHDMKTMIKVFQAVSKMPAPVLVHVLTKKGKGYDFTEKNPGTYHSVSPGFLSKNEKSAAKTDDYSSVFSNTVIQMAHEDKTITAVSAAMAHGTGLYSFQKKYPDRFFDVGIAEQHAVTFAAGMATKGMIPIVAIYSTFLQRAYDQVLHDVALQNLHVIFAVDRSGLNACDGETHHGIYDVSFLLPMPNLTLLSPADYNDLEKMLHYAVKECRGPVVIRYPKGVGGRIEENRKPIKTGVGIATGKGDIALVGTGRMLDFAYEVQKELRKRQKDAIVINPRFLKPLDEAFYRSCMFSCEQTVIIEESCEIGGFCTYLSTRLNDWGYQGRLMRIGLPDRVITSEDCSYVFQSCNYSPQNVADALIRSKNECPIVTPLSTVTKVE